MVTRAKNTEKIKCITDIADCDQARSVKVGNCHLWLLTDEREGCETQRHREMTQENISHLVTNDKLRKLCKNRVVSKKKSVGYIVTDFKRHSLRLF